MCDGRYEKNKRMCTLVRIKRRNIILEIRRQIAYISRTVIKHLRHSERGYCRLIKHMYRYLNGIFNYDFHVTFITAVFVVLTVLIIVWNQGKLNEIEIFPIVRIRIFTLSMSLNSLYITKSLPDDAF